MMCIWAWEGLDFLKMMFEALLCPSQGNQSVSIDWTSRKPSTRQGGCQSSGSAVGDLKVLVRALPLIWLLNVYGSHLISALSGNNNNNESVIDCLLCTRHWYMLYIYYFIYSS